MDTCEVFVAVRSSQRAVCSRSVTKTGHGRSHDECSGDSEPRTDHGERGERYAERRRRFGFAAAFARSLRMYLRMYVRLHSRHSGPFAG